MKADPFGKKQVLRDWMIATTQLMKVKDHAQTNADIVEKWRSIGIKMNEAWVKRALYGGNNEGLSS